MQAIKSPPSSPGLAAFLNAARCEVDAALDSYLPPIVLDADATCPARLAQAMRYSVMAGGKRLRPILALMAVEACGAPRARAMPVACSLELIHTYSLIHDDLPAMDDDDLRRGRPTCHRAFDEATAVLAGDALLTLAFEVIARDITPPASAIACVQTVATGAGMDGMVGGQMSDLLAEHCVDATVEDLERIHRRKTGALLRASLVCGGIVGNASAECTAALDAYGAAVGLAFQIVDDLLDVEGDEAKLGKRVRKDADLGKHTYPGLLGVDASRSLARSLAQSACEALTPFGERADRLRELAWDLVERDR